LSIWYEDEKVVERGNAFRRAILSPLVDKLGFDYPANEPIDKSQLRTLVIAAAANAAHKGYEEPVFRQAHSFNICRFYAASLSSSSGDSPDI
jgi:hypothetical protein